MKKRIIPVALALIFVLLLIPPVDSKASQYPCFTGANDTLLPFRDATMPAYFNSKLYVPASVFAEFGISSGTSASQNNLLVYRTSEKKRLNFFISLGHVLDQDGAIYEDVGLEIIDGLYFLPLEFMCEFFGLTYKLIANDPVSVLRIKDSTAVFNDKTFIGYYKNEMETAYSDYNTPATPTPTPQITPPPAESPAQKDFSSVKIMLSFYGVEGTHVSSILDILGEHSVTSCFFLTAAEIAADPALVRRISGEKHMLGIRLENADLNEYTAAAKLLFEAAKVKTPLVTSSPDISEEVATLCAENGLLYSYASIWPEEGQSAAVVSAQIPTDNYASADIRFDCTSGTSRILSAIIRYLNEYKYSIQIPTETSLI